MSTELKPDPNLQLLIFLNRLLDRVDLRFENQPQVKVNLRAALSHSFNILGRHEDASRLCREYWEFLCETKGRQHPDSIRVARQLITFYIDEFRLDDVEQLIHQALADSREVLGDEDETTLSIQTDLANLVHERGDFVAAVKIHTDCLNSKIRIYGNDDIETLITKSKLASVYVSLARFDDAEDLHRQVLESNQQKQDPHRKLRVAASLNNLAKCFLNRGIVENSREFFLEAESLLAEGLELYPDTLEIKQNLSQVYLELGRFDEAEPMLLELEERLKILRGAEAPATLEITNMLGMCYMLQGRMSQAAFSISGAVEILQRVRPESHQLLKVMDNLAIVYRRMGKLEDSIRIDQELLNLLARQTGNKRHPSLPSLARLGMNHFDLGNLDTGRRELESAFHEAEDLPGSYQLAGMLANSYLREGLAESKSGPAFEKAQLWTDLQIESGQRLLGAEDQRFASLLIECAERQLEMREFVLAEENARRSLKVLQPIENDSIERLRANSVLAESLQWQQRYVEAEQILANAYQQIQDSGAGITNQSKRLQLVVVEQLISINLSTGDAGQASRWRDAKSQLLVANGSKVQ